MKKGNKKLGNKSSRSRKSHGGTRKTRRLRIPHNALAPNRQNEGYGKGGVTGRGGEGQGAGKQTGEQEIHAGTNQSAPGEIGGG